MKLRTLVTVERKTMTGIETIMGQVVAPVFIDEDENGKEFVSFVTVEGMVVSTKINGLPLPDETERSVKLPLVPTKNTKFTKIKEMV